MKFRVGLVLGCCLSVVAAPAFAAEGCMPGND